MARLPAEDDESLWTLALAPLSWASHLLASYATAAIWCAKFASPAASLSPVRALVGVYTVAALVVIAFVGLRAFARHRKMRGRPSSRALDDAPADTDPYQGDSGRARHGFLSLATALLSALSAVAVVFQALSAVFIGSCR